MSTAGFMPHGMCYLWQPGLLGLHVVSDSLIALAYYSIPFTLLIFVLKRKDLRFMWVFVCFAAFIVACGTSHVMEVVTVWRPDYWLSGGVKALTAIASVPTAILLVRLLPTALRVPSPSALEATNRELAREIAERKRAELAILTINESLETRVAERTAGLAAALRERESLLQEVHHRVKNNLQVIASLISMQRRALTDPATRDALQHCRSRVEAMAQIHEMLYQAKNYAHIPFSKYAKELTLRIMSASGADRPGMEMEFDLEEISFGLGRAIPCGLILNELVSNAFKHAFPGDAVGRVAVKLKRLADERVLLLVADDGVGIAADFDPERTDSLGLQLVLALVQQLDGELDMVRTPGAAFRITFALDPSG